MSTLTDPTQGLIEAVGDATCWELNAVTWTLYELWKSETGSAR